MTDQWFVKILGEELGPIPYSNLVDLVTSESLSADDQVRRETETLWVPARSVPGLFSNVLDGWYCRILGHELGPMPLEDLRKMARQGELSPGDGVRSGSDSDWIPARKVSQLFARKQSSRAVQQKERKKPVADAEPSTLPPRTYPSSQEAVVTTSQIPDPGKQVTTVQKPAPVWRPQVKARKDSWYVTLIERAKDHPKAVSVTGIFILAVPILYFSIFTGGPDSSNVEPEEPHPMTDAYPIMLDGQKLRTGNTNLTLRRDRIFDIEVHEISDKASDGSYTATISFNIKSGSSRIHAKVDIRYKIQVVEAQKGFSIPTYPVSSFNALSVEKIGP